MVGEHPIISSDIFTDPNIIIDPTVPESILTDVTKRSLIKKKDNKIYYRD